jgi:hypothetical protein
MTARLSYTTHLIVSINSIHQNSSIISFIKATGKFEKSSETERKNAILPHPGFFGSIASNLSHTIQNS